MEENNTIKKNIFYMKKVLALAKRAEGLTAPNPMVGAIIEKENKIYGQGYHKRAGGPHAEVIALQHAAHRTKKSVKGCTLYVNLEPCCYTGKTPPCTKAIIKSGIKKVVIGMKDPNPLVAGKGIEELKNAGIAVTLGVLEQSAKKLNEIFCKYINSGIPFITLKAAVTLDGKIATHKGNSTWITGESARNYVHKQRYIHDAVMVGIGTVLADNPLLTCRHTQNRVSQTNNKMIARIIVDSTAQIPQDARVLNKEPWHKTIVAVTGRALKRKITALQQKNVEVITTKSKGGRVDIHHLFQLLGEKGISSILVEGGGTLNASIIENNLADKLLLFIAPIIIGGKDAPTFIEGKGKARIADAFTLSFTQKKWFHRDLMLEYYFNIETPGSLPHTGNSLRNRGE